MNEQHTVLVVDDEEDVRLFVKTALQADGYKVFPASNGPEALATARQEKPDVILLDVMMPGMDGFTVLKELRKETTTQRIPVVMLTILADRDRKVLALERGVQYYITKPFDVQDLLSKVRLAIEEGGAGPEL